VKVTALYVSIQGAAAGIFYSLTKMADGFEEVGYQLRLVAPAINKFLILRQAMISAYSAAGINLVKAVQQSILFNYSLAKTKYALEAVYKSVGIKFLPLLTKQMDIFRKQIFANMPKIQEQLTRFVNFIFKAFSATVELGERMWSILGRVWDFFKKLDEATSGWSTKIIAVIAAWKLLNLEFLATPLGALLAGLLAILALYDDFKVWQEGGKSFFNWGSQATKTVLGVAAAVTAMVTAIGAVIAVIRLATAAQWLWDVAMDANPIGLIVIGVTALIGLLTALAVKLGYLKGIGDYLSNLGGKVEGLFGGPGAANTLNAAVQPQPLVSPHAGGNTQKVSQETNILVQGGADANAVGKAVASEQNKVNFDMTRNLRGAIR